MYYLPTYITAAILSIIYTAQLLSTTTATLSKTRNLLYFLAMVLFVAVINLLFGDRTSGTVVAVGAIAWLLIILLTPGPKAEPPPVRCASAAQPQPLPLPTPTYECQQCDGSSDTIDCIDLKL
jgi:hypothetical protein